MDVSVVDTITTLVDFNVETTAAPWNNYSNMQPPPQNDTRTAWTWFLGSCLLLTAILTLMGNAVVMATFYSEKRRLLHSNFNLFLVNLTVTDIAVSITAIPFYALSYMKGDWPFGKVMCGLWIFCDWGMTFASVYTLVGISVDRHWAVCWSHHYRANNTRRRINLMIALIWVFVLVLWIPPFIYDQIYSESCGVGEHSNCTCEWSVNKNWTFAILMSVFGYHLPSAIIVYCYIRVFFVMHKSRATLKNASHHGIALRNNKGNSRLSRDMVDGVESTDSITSQFIKDAAAHSHNSREHSIENAEHSSGHSGKSPERHVDDIVTDINFEAALAETHPDGNLTSPHKLGIGSLLRSKPIANQRNRNVYTQSWSPDAMTSSPMMLDGTNGLASITSGSGVGFPRKSQSTASLELSSTLADDDTNMRHHGHRLGGRSFTGSGGTRAFLLSRFRNKHQRNLSGQSAIDASRDSRVKSLQTKDDKLFIRVTYIIMAYILCWTPFHVVFDIQLCGIEVDTNWYTFATLMCYLNSTINPILYARGNPKLKTAIKRTVRCQSKKRGTRN